MERVSTRAAAICVLRADHGLVERLRAAPRRAGRVHSVFERALNLEWHDGRLLALQGPGPLRAPFAASLAWFPGATLPRPGLPVWRRDDMLVVDGIVLDPRGALGVDTTMPEAGAGLHPALAVLAAPLPVAPGLLSAVGHAARSRLAEGVRGRDPVAFIQGALGLLGLGEGLTPAGDDCLVGALAVLHRFARPWLSAHPEIAATVGRAAVHATTAIAREFVAQALAGRFSESLLDLLTAESADEVGGAAARLSQSGATSGADTLAGVHLALAALGASRS
jgi:hypothetical protein